MLLLPTWCHNGAKTLIPYLDALVAYLTWAKMGLGFKQLAALLSIKKAKLVLAIENLESPLLAALYKMVEKSVAANTSCPYIGLLLIQLLLRSVSLVDPLRNQKIKSTSSSRKLLFWTLPPIMHSSSPFHLGSEHDSSIHN